MYTQKKNLNSDFFFKVQKNSTQKIFEKKIDQKSKILIFEKLGFSIFGRKNPKKNLDRKKSKSLRIKTAWIWLVFRFKVVCNVYLTAIRFRKSPKINFCRVREAFGA